MRGFRLFFVYIAHFPQKSKLYGEINWYIRHPTALILGQVVNGPDPAPVSAKAETKRRDKSVAGPWIGGEILLLPWHPLPGLGVGRGGLLGGDIRPALGILGVERQPLLEPWLGVRLDRLDRAFRLAHTTINAFVGMDDEHVLAFIEAVDRTYLYTVHQLALDATFIDDVGHLQLQIRPGAVTSARLPAGQEIAAIRGR